MRIAPLVLACITLLYSVTGQCRSLQDIKKDGTLKVATEGSFPPFNYVKDNRITGFEVDLVDEMARRIGLKTVWQAKSFDGLLIGLQQDRYDVVAASHAITPEREKAVAFLTPHYCSGGVVIALKGGPKSLRDLKGKTVGAQVSSIYPRFLENQAPGSEVRSYPTDPDVVQALLNHKVDAALTDLFMVKRIIKTHPEIQLGDLANPERNGIALSKDNRPLQEALDRALATLLSDGTYKRLSQQYFDEDIRCKSSR